MEKTAASLKAWAESHITWFGQSAFRVRTDAGPAVFIDPFMVPPRAGPADLILVTHPHRDHYDRKAIRGLSRAATKVVLPRSCAGSGEIGMSPGESLSFGEARVSGIPAYNLEKRFHPRSCGWLGYLIEAGGLRIYHAGDTDSIPEMRDLRPDIALIPIGGTFAMDGAEALEAVDLMKATLAVPMHYGMLGILLGGRGAGRRFAAAIGEKGLVLPRSRA
jgi:L-ascorbate metabolism protein UlaG (beta-lactamase superfamily)